MPSQSLVPTHMGAGRESEDLRGVVGWIRVAAPARLAIEIKDRKSEEIDILAWCWDAIFLKVQF